MQSRSKFRFRKTTTPPVRHPGSDPERAPRLVAAAGAVLITVLGVASLVTPTPAPPVQHASVKSAPHSIGGIPVFDLPSVDVNAAVMGQSTGNAMASDTTPVDYSNSLLRKLSGDADPIILIGTQVSMPYYSFGSQLGHISKD